MALFMACIAPRVPYFNAVTLYLFFLYSFIDTTVCIHALMKINIYLSIYVVLPKQSSLFWLIYPHTLDFYNLQSSLLLYAVPFLYYLYVSLNMDAKLGHNTLI